MRGGRSLSYGTLPCGSPSTVSTTSFVNCKDVEITASWYQRVLGMEREEFGDGNPQPR